MNVNPKYPIHEECSNSFFNEFFYYGHRRYEVIRKADNKLLVKEVYRPQSHFQIALKVALIFTGIIPLIAAICLMIQSKKWASIKEIEVTVPLKPEEIVEAINKGKKDIDDLVPQEEIESFLKDHGSLIRRLDLRGLGENSILTCLKYCGNIIELVFNGNISTEVIKLLSSIQFNNLKTLNLGRDPFSKDAIKLLAQSPILKNLTCFSLENSFIQDKGVKYLSKSEHLKNIKVLDLSSCGITDEGVFLLANSPNFNNIKVLVLSNNSINQEGAQHIAQSKTLGKLTRLFINGNRICFEGVKWLAQFSQLEELDIRYNLFFQLQKPEIKALFNDKVNLTV